MVTPVDLTVLLGSRWAELEHHGTRWRALLTRWAGDPRLGSLTVVDFPRFSLRGPRLAEQPSWLPGVRSLRLTVPASPTRTLGSGAGWRLAARALGSCETVVAATPLWAPLLPRLDAQRRCFDAVDDWRALASVGHLRARVDEGYRVLPQLDLVTAVSVELGRRLAQDVGARPVVVPNGVQLSAYAGTPAPPPGLPDGPFAVYVGSVERRVDLDLLRAVAEQVPVVVAGPADAESAAWLRAAPLCWLGPLDVDQVPGLLRHAAVGLLPHRVDALTESMDPMKLLEYLAAGLPVVATDLPGVRLSDRVVVAGTPGAFAEAARQQLHVGRAESPDPAVADRDWDVVAERLLGHVLGRAA